MDPKDVVENFRRIVTTQYIAFDGRSRRREFWYYALAFFFLTVAASILDNILGFGGPYDGNEAAYVYFSPLTGLLELALLLPSLGLVVRRLHDTDHTGWLAVAGVIPIVGWILLIYWYVQPGTAGTNKYGPDPKAPTAKRV